VHALHAECCPAVPPVTDQPCGADLSGACTSWLAAGPAAAEAQRSQLQRHEGCSGCCLCVAVAGVSLLSEFKLMSVLSHQGAARLADEAFLVLSSVVGSH
jgi:hypothetical protein